MSTYVVDVKALRENIRQIQQVVEQSVVIWAVIKGDGYGLGAEAFSTVLMDEGICHFAVTESSEAEAVRRISETAEILMLRPTCDIHLLTQLLQQNVICTISSLEDASVISALAQSLDLEARVHCKIDTGMGRYGFRTDELTKLLPVSRMPNIVIEGAYTHFHSAFCNEKQTRQQYERFQAAITELRQSGVKLKMCHCCNSSAALRFPEMHMDAVRIGSAFLGRLSFPTQLNLQKIGWCETNVEEIHPIKKGETTGYGAGWRAKRDTRLAIVPVGYYHGFGAEKGRDLFRLRDCIRGAVSLMLAALRKKKLTVLIKEKTYPVRGHIGMLHSAIDITGAEILHGDAVRIEINPLLQKTLPVEYRNND